MAYRDKIAPKRENPVADTIMDSVPNTDSSNQTRTVPQTSKFRSVGTPDKFNNGTLVRTQGNTKGTGVAGRPSSIGLQDRKSAKSASVNPDGARNRTAGRA